MVHVLYLGRLVGDESYHHFFRLLFQFDDAAQRVFHQDGFAAEPSAQVQEKLVERAVIDKVVNLSAVHFRYPAAQRSHVLPVAVMPQIKQAELFSFALHVGAHLVETHKLHAPAHLLMGYGKELDYFYHVIAKEMVKIFLYLQYLRRAFFGETFRKVFLYHLAAVLNPMEQGEKQDIGHNVK